MKQYSLYFLILLLTIACTYKKVKTNATNDLNELRLNGKVKSAKTEIFEYSENDGNYVIGEKRNSFGLDRNSTLEFNTQGNLTNKIEHYVNGKISKKDDYVYNSKGILEQLISTDYYGGKTQIDTTTYYFKNDSLIKLERKESGTPIVTNFYRNKDNFMTKATLHINDTITNTVEYTYDASGNTLSEYWYGGVDKNLVQKIEKEYQNNRIQSKAVMRLTQFDTISHQVNYQYENDGKKITFKVTDDTQEVGETVIRIYGDDLSLLEETIIYNSNGATFSKVKRVWDENEELIEYVSTYANTNEERSTTTAITYDDMNNWIEKKNFNNGKPTTIVKRNITYYTE